VKSSLLGTCQAEHSQFARRPVSQFNPADSNCTLDMPITVSNDRIDGFGRKAWHNPGSKA
jgi:hypothetical protein